jgi:polysaccharide biosynthesis transport protein
MASEIVEEFKLDDLLKERRLDSTDMRDRVKRTLSAVVGAVGGLFGGGGEPKTSEWWKNEAAAEFLEDWNRIEVERDTSVINVTILGTSPELSANISRYVAERLSLLVREHARERFAKMQSFVAGNMTGAEARLADAAEELRGFLETEDPLLVEKERDLLLLRRDRLSSQLVDAESDHEGAKQRLAELRRQLEGQDIRVETREEVEARNPAVSQLKTELLRLETEMAALALDLQEDHPARRELAEKVRTTRESLELEVTEDFQSRTVSERFNPLYVQTARQIADAIYEVAAAEARSSAFRNLQRGTDERLTALGGRFAGLESRRADLDRQVDAAESYYLKLKERAMELDALAGSPEGEFDLRTIDPAHNPTGNEVSSPLWDLVLPVAFVVAVFISLFVAFFLEYWRNTYRAPWELEAETGVEILATVPRMGRGNK